MIGDSQRRVGDDMLKARDLRVAMLLDEWEHSGNKARVRCARQLVNAWKADDVLGAFVQVLDNGRAEGLDELRALLRVVETVDLGGYTQRDADAVAVAMWAAGYRRHTSGVHYVIEFDYRSDGGPDRVGPFATRDAAAEYARGLQADGFEAVWGAIPVQAPH